MNAPGHATVTESKHTIRYEIQVYREGCCDDHKEPGWYSAKLYRGILSNPYTSQDHAEILLERARNFAPQARYRLVEIEEIHQVTERVVAS